MYKLRICAQDCTQDSNWKTNNSTGTSYTIHGLQAGTSYQVQVRTAKTTSGNTILSDWTASETQATSGTAPTVSAPATPALVSGGTQLTVNWTAVTNANGGYQVQYCKVHATTCQANGVGDDWNTTTADTANATKGVVEKSGQASTSVDITGLTDGSTYRVRMRAVRSFTNPPFSIESLWSNTANKITRPPPAKPTGFSATAQSNTEIKMSWTASTSCLLYTSPSPRD